MALTFLSGAGRHSVSIFRLPQEGVSVEDKYYSTQFPILYLQFFAVFLCCMGLFLLILRCSKQIIVP